MEWSFPQEQPQLPQLPPLLLCLELSSTHLPLAQLPNQDKCSMMPSLKTSVLLATHGRVQVKILMMTMKTPAHAETRLMEMQLVPSTLLLQELWSFPQSKQFKTLMFTQLAQTLQLVQLTKMSMFTKPSKLLDPSLPINMLALKLQAQKRTIGISMVQDLDHSPIVTTPTAHATVDASLLRTPLLVTNGGPMRRTTTTTGKKKRFTVPKRILKLESITKLIRHSVIFCPTLLKDASLPVSKVALKYGDEL